MKNAQSFPVDSYIIVSFSQFTRKFFVGFAYRLLVQFEKKKHVSIIIFSIHMPCYAFHSEKRIVKL